MKTNLKELIAQAGFKSQADFARYYDDATVVSVCAWCKKPPRRVVQYLTLIIRCNVLEKENMKLSEALKTFKQYTNQI